MATTANKIQKALQILNNQDWFWCMDDNNSAYGYARASMREFVELVATINDSAIVKALRDLWVATYNYKDDFMFNGRSEKAEHEYESTKANLMAIIMPQACAA